MSVSWHLVARTALQGALVLILFLAGGVPDPFCATAPGIPGLACGAGNAGPVAGLLLDEARALVSDRAAKPSKTECDPTPLLVAAARGVPFVDGARAAGKLFALRIAAAASPFYIRHCAFLC